MSRHPDDEWRTVPSRPEKRKLLKKLRRLPAARTGRPWTFRHKTGSPVHFVQWAREGLIRDLRAKGVSVQEKLPEGGPGFLRSLEHAEARKLAHAILTITEADR